MKILYILHYGYNPKKIFYNKKTKKLRKIIRDGGTNIHVNLIENFYKKNYPITISTFKNNYQLLAFFGNKKINIDTFWIPKNFYNFFIDNIYKAIILPFRVFIKKYDYEILISATDFLPDVIYSFLIKLKNPQIKWVASFFLKAPSPFLHRNPYKVGVIPFIKGFIYWFFQLFSCLLIKLKSDIILVTSSPDVKRFISNKRGEENIVIVKGGINIRASERAINNKRLLKVEKRRYDAVLCLTLI